MISRVYTSVLQGIDSINCEVEVDVSTGGIGEIKLVGLAKSSAKEATSRIQSALRNSGYYWPGPRVVINLAPADLQKNSASFDLAIATGLLLADGQLVSEISSQYTILGELSLDGRVRPVRGALAAAMMTRTEGRTGVIVPEENAREAAVVDNIEVIPVKTLEEIVRFFAGNSETEPLAVDVDEIFRDNVKHQLDYSDVRGQESAKRALMLASAGAHNLLMIGPPGSGKSMLSKRLPSILPPLTLQESLETTRIYSAKGLLKPQQSLLTSRPVRTPHHTASGVSLVGGGAIPMPGEISLAHHGVLFLDEFPEFPRATLENIRQPLEDRSITIPRVHSTICYPASIMLIAAMNPCPCGYYTDPARPCKCSQNQVDKYLSRISGPLVDRIDIHIEVPPVSWKHLRQQGESNGLSSTQMRSVVLRAREVQRLRFSGDTGHTITNATMTPSQIRKYCPLDRPSESLLKQAMTELGLSARAHDKILRTARTIADIDEQEQIQPHHIAEAIQYRRLDRKL